VADVIPRVSGFSVRRQAPLPFLQMVRSFARSGVRWLGLAIDFIILEKNLIVRAIRLQSSGSLLGPFNYSLRYMFVVNAHVWAFWELGRMSPNGTSWLVFFSAGFVTYTVFGVARRARPSKSLNPSNMSLNIKWINLFIANFMADTIKIILTFVLQIIFYTMFPVRFMGHQFSFPNLPLLTMCFIIAAASGAGLGMMIHTAISKWPALESIQETFFWVIFVTSGVYMPLSSLPASVAYYFTFNPLLTALEFSRYAVDPAYPIDQLNLPYAAAVGIIILFLGLACRRVERAGRGSWG
jgi:ABC-type polysaccharide/polyol phosphate export permease